MELVSLVLAVVALAVALLALRRADVVGRRAGRRPEPASRPAGTGAPDDLPVVTGDAGAYDPGETDPDADREPVRRGLRRLGRGQTDPNQELIHRLDKLDDDLRSRISRVEIIRYDAFEGAGGQFSFSLAMLDDRGNGLVLTSIHAPSETRTYVKEIPLPDDPLLPGELSPEEREVLRRASAGISRRDRKDTAHDSAGQ